MEKCIVLYSGGLDSRLAIKILKEQGLDVLALFFKLPFGCSQSEKSTKFLEEEGVKFETIDITKGNLLKEYLEILKNPYFGRGRSFNPCKDCKIFMFKKAKEYADRNNIKIIASGEVLGQRPMSQTRSSLKLIDKELGFEILRPLSAKLLEETSYEREGLVKRDKLYAFKGRSRKGQIELAKKFKIEYPNPAGGCFLCEKAHFKRLETLIKNNLLNENNIILSKIGRHFIIDGCWFVVSRDKKESEVIDRFESSIKGEVGKPAVFFNNADKKGIALLIQNAYSKNSSKENKKKFEIHKL